MVRDELVERLLEGDATLFEGRTASHALGWMRHPESYFGTWLDETSQRLPRRHDRAILLGMGGSSSPARLYAESRPHSRLSVLDTSNPDTIYATDFSDVTLIASSKSGNTIETLSLLAHALGNGLRPADLVVVSDPGTALEAMAESIGATFFSGDPSTGGRFSGLSPFGLVPALYAGWTIQELRIELAGCWLTPELARRAVAEAANRAEDIDAGTALYQLGGDPIASGGALWLEQLIAETTGKSNRGFIPVLAGSSRTYLPSEMQHHHLVAALLARFLDVDPFDQPNVESAKRDVFALLEEPVSWRSTGVDVVNLRNALAESTYNVLQAFAPLESSIELARLRERTESAYGTTTANFGPRYLHSTGQLHKGGPPRVAAVQIVVRPASPPVLIAGRNYTFHDLHMAQAQSDVRAMTSAGRRVWQLIVDDFDEAAQILGLET